MCAEYMDSDGDGINDADDEDDDNDGVDDDDEGVNDCKIMSSVVRTSLYSVLILAFWAAVPIGDEVL